MSERIKGHPDKSGLVVVKGNGLIDQFTEPIGPDDPFPKEYKPGGKYPVATIQEAYDRIGLTLPVISTRIGGNGLNTAVDLSRLGRNVILQTPLGEDESGKDIKQRLKDEQVILDNQPADATLAALVIPRLYIDEETGELRRDRTIFSVTSDNLPAGFTYNGYDVPNLAYITSIKEAQHGLTYREFTEFTDNVNDGRGIDRGVSPGSLQIAAVLSSKPEDQENKKAIYKAINGGYLIGNLDELRALVEGVDTPEDTKIGLLRQGKEVLKPGLMVITDGPKGSWYVDENESIIQTPALGKDSDVVATVGSGDAHGAAVLDAIMSNFPAEMTARYGALDARAVLSGEGAHETSLNVEDIRRLAEELYDDREFRQTVYDPDGKTYNDMAA